MSVQGNRIQARCSKNKALAVKIGHLSIIFSEFYGQQSLQNARFCMIFAPSFGSQGAWLLYLTKMG
ncbi:MAG TPA: hypothetical protein DIW30_00610 [Bacteroidales bacterium]|nr:hypothetical protein [Bacteroidales bacterium]